MMAAKSNPAGQGCHPQSVTASPEAPRGAAPLERSWRKVIELADDDELLDWLNLILDECRKRLERLEFITEADEAMEWHQWEIDLLPAIEPMLMACGTARARHWADKIRNCGRQIKPDRPRVANAVRGKQEFKAFVTSAFYLQVRMDAIEDCAREVSRNGKFVVKGRARLTPKPKSLNRAESEAWCATEKQRLLDDKEKAERDSFCKRAVKGGVKSGFARAWFEMNVPAEMKRPAQRPRSKITR